MKLFGIWTILVALSISIVAAYYSIVGLVAIFAAAFVPIVIMGVVLELGKLTTAVWLHTYWHQANIAIKSYLSFALVMLMFITSMGIFGFLSKAHIEQTAQATEGAAQLERIETEILRYEEVIERAEQKILKLESSDDTADSVIQEKINQEQDRISTAYDRVQPLIDEQRQLLLESISPYQTQLDSIDQKLDMIQQYISSNDIIKLQQLIGTKPDGDYGPETARKVDEFREKLNEQRKDVLQVVQKLRQDNQKEIARIRKIAENEIADSNKLVSRLRAQLGTGSSEDVTSDIQGQRTKIKSADQELEILIEQKYSIERENRVLEAEVGPVKYIAELIYGENADKNALEEAVRWVIIILVLVFDPLAIVLVIAGITLLEKSTVSRRIPDTESHQEVVEEQPDEFAELNELAVDTGSSEVEEWEENDERMDVIGQNGNDGLHYDEVEMDDVVDAMESIQEEINEIRQEIETEEIFDSESQSGDKHYHIQQEQIDLNQKAKERREQEAKEQIEQVVTRMKEEGRWPNPPSPTERVALDAILDADDTGQLTELLERADENTLKEVYTQLIEEVNQKKS